MSAPTCGHDSGSATGCRPLCDAPAVVGITYGYGAYRVTVNVCQRHVATTHNRVWPEVGTVGPVKR